jgi:hypothetical protein
MNNYAWAQCNRRPVVACTRQRKRVWSDEIDPVITFQRPQHGHDGDGPSREEQGPKVDIPTLSMNSQLASSVSFGRGTPLSTTQSSWSKVLISEVQSRCSREAYPALLPAGRHRQHGEQVPNARLCKALIDRITDR